MTKRLRLKKFLYFYSMKLSGFTFVRDAVKLYYPIKESILSILPIVDEFVIALGDCSEGDKTKEQILSINSPKIKIIETVWDIEKYPRGMEHAHQTDIAKSHCSGDWLFYVQGDEVVHEKYHNTILKACTENLTNEKVEGLLFNYLHFYADYEHYVWGHGWYQNEIRIVRNLPDIHSYISAQSFRRIPNFDGLNYRQKENTFKLNVKAIDAYIYHYGWVRPPELMQSKSKVFNTTHQGENGAKEMYKDQPDYYDYGPLNKMERFNGSHPIVMKDKIADFFWADQLNYGDRNEIRRPKMKHEKPKYQFLSFLEKHLNGGKEIFGYSNWKLIK